MYQLATKFGGRPWEYLAPHLTDVQLQLSLDFAVNGVGKKQMLRETKASRKKQAEEGMLSRAASRLKKR